MDVSAILLDFDDTLIHSTRAYETALQSLDLGAGSARRAAYDEARDRVKRRLPTGHPAARNRVLYFLEMLRVEGRPSGVEALRLADRWHAAVAGDLARQWAALGRAALVESLGRAAPILLLSNENARTQLVKLQALDPEGRLFRDLVVSEEVGAEKPDPGLLREAFRRLGVAPAACLVVGDSPEADIGPALAEGCRCVVTREFEDRGPVPAGVAEIDSLEEIRAMVTP